MKRLGGILIAVALFGWLTRFGYQSTHVENAHRLALAIDTLASEDAAISHQLVVEFRDGESATQRLALAHKFGVEFTAESKFSDVDEIFVVHSDDPERLLAGLRAEPEVAASDFDFVYRLPESVVAATAGTPEVAQPGFPNDPKFKLQWHLDQIHIKPAWKTAQGDGVIVAVIDTGVAPVPDLAASDLVAGYNFVSNREDARDDHGHGTHVAGTIAQATNNGIGVAGIAFGAKIMPIKVLSARGSGSVSGIAAGIRFAADHGAKVINMSLGGGLASSVLQKAVSYAHDKGVTVVCAAGNDGRGKVSYPAAYVGAIAVAATQFDESTTFYSNWGKEIDLAAPGGNTRVDQNGDGFPDGVLQNTVVPGDVNKNDYLWFMGTSMASPHVAGVAALVISAGVSEPDAVEKVLLSSARKPSAKPKDGENRYGSGLLDAEQAVKKAKLEFGGWQLAFGFAAAALLGWYRRAKFGFGGMLALVFGSSGLFFLPGTSLLSRSFADLLPGNPLFLSALFPLLLIAIGYSVKRLRGALTGFALGVGATLLFHALFRTVDVRFVPNFLDGAWLCLNAALLFTVGSLTLRNRDSLQ